MVLLENESFLSELTKLFQKYRSSGSVYITMKRYDGRTKPKPRQEKLAANPIQPPAEYKCLLRAHAGPNKISTVINAKDVNRFQLIQRLGSNLQPHTWQCNVIATELPWQAQQIS
ncbi:signal recognition particle 14 kDa protein isoform X1 [Dermacentor andersoni]|uniref:signal recognition particle 14 kDa protein isoform X1 n=1 Tax=Dermacentor andersoni TaxID=34620 RepID=UPI002415F2B3|nr:signal recognition particle 14 kDa protein-like isoform X1 [Dermacentor andersoni]